MTKILTCGRHKFWHVTVQTMLTSIKHERSHWNFLKNKNSIESKINIKIKTHQKSKYRDQITN